MKKLYVGNIDFSATAQEIRELFETYGQIETLQWMTDKITGRFLGYGFVEMKDETAATSAMHALDGKQLGGRTLRVNEAGLRQSDTDI